MGEWRIRLILESRYQDIHFFLIRDQEKGLFLKMVTKLSLVATQCARWIEKVRSALPMTRQVFQEYLLWQILFWVYITDSCSTMFWDVGFISNNETPLYSTINSPTNIIALTCDLNILTKKSYIKISISRVVAEWRRTSDYRSDTTSV